MLLENWGRFFSPFQSLRCGTTGVVTFIRGNMLHVAWLGDSQVMLVRRGQAVELMKPHKPDREVRTACWRRAGQGLPLQLAATSFTWAAGRRALPHPCLLERQRGVPVTLAGLEVGLFAHISALRGPAGSTALRALLKRSGCGGSTERAAQTALALPCCLG